MVAAASPTIVFRNNQRIVSLVTHLQMKEFRNAKYVFGVWKMCPESASSEVRTKLLQMTEGYLEKTVGEGASRGWFAAASEAVNVLFALSQRFDVVAEHVLWRVAREMFVGGVEKVDVIAGDKESVITGEGIGRGVDRAGSNDRNEVNGGVDDVTENHVDDSNSDHVHDITNNHIHNASNNHIENTTSDHIDSITHNPTHNITNKHTHSNITNSITNNINNNINNNNITNNITNSITNNHAMDEEPSPDTPSEVTAESSPSLPRNPTEASLARFLFLLGQVALKLLQFTEQVATQAKRIRHRKEEEERQKKAAANAMGLVTVSEDIEEEEMERISATEIVVK